MDYNSKCIIVNSTLSNNTVKNNGAALAIYGHSNCNIQDSRITNNSASNDGGAILLQHSMCNIINSRLTNNRAKRQGGAIDAYNASCTVIDSTFSNNTAKNGSVMYYRYLCNISVQNSNLTNNNALQNGGALYSDINSTTHITNSIIANNTATNQGGAIYNKSSKLDLNNVTFISNEALEGNDICNYSIKTKIIFSKIPESDYRDNLTISGKITKEDGKSISNSYFIFYLTVNKVKINLKTNYDGKFSTVIQLNKTGKWTIKAVFKGSDPYSASNATTTFNVSKRNTTINANINDAIINNEITINGNLKDKTNTKLKNANIYITINEEEYHVLTDSKATFTLDYTPTKLGTNNITIQYNGNKNYRETNITTTFEVNDEIDVKSSYYRDNVTIKALLKDNDEVLKNTEVNLTINGETIAVSTDENGVLDYTCKSKKAGNNILEITCNNLKWTKNFTTQKRNTTIIMNRIPIYPGESCLVSGSFVDQSNTKMKNAHLYITLDGVTEHLITDFEGTFLINFGYKDQGTYNVTFVYKGNSNYLETRTESTITVQ